MLTRFKEGGGILELAHLLVTYVAVLLSQSSPIQFSL